MVTGAALAKTMLEQPGIAVAFFGDGAACEGIFHESLNLAAVWQLPVLYVCENNSWQAFVHRREAMAAKHVVDHAGAYGIPGRAVDGNDVVEVYVAAQEAAETIRHTGRPYFLELETYRMRGHFEPDDQAYVDPAELAAWQARDPIRTFERRLKESGQLTSAAVEAMHAGVQARIETAAAFAAATPYPAAAELLTDVYA
jgi:pyruvate dehydrogenase E1 component alpha subunit